MTDQTCALVVHKQTYPGDEFDFDAARIIWKTNDKLESKMVESACIRQLPSCNIGCGEVSMGPIMVSAINKIANLQKSNSSANRRLQHASPLYTAKLYTPPVPPPPLSPLPSPAPTLSPLISNHSSPQHRHTTASQPVTQTIVPYMSRKLSSSQQEGSVANGT